MKHLAIISLGLLNFLHGSLHVAQFIQSMLLVSYSVGHHHEPEGFIDGVMHSPLFGLSMGLIGLITLIIGVKDYIHHKKCNHHS
jgi:hypothetical protein